MGSSASKINKIQTNGITGLSGDGSNVTNGYNPASQLVGFNINWAAGGSPGGNGAQGNDTTAVAGTWYWVQLLNDANCTATGIDVLVGTVGGTDKWITAVYDVTGKLVANSATAGVTAATAGGHTSLPFVAPFTLVGPAIFFVAVQSNGTTARFRSYNIGNSPFITGSAAGTFGTVPTTLTPGSTYNNNVGPICCTY